MPSPAVTLAVVLLIGASGAIVGFLYTEEHRRLEESDAPPEWTYFHGEEGETPYGPSDWGESFEDCYGDMQSPINLSDAHQVVKHSGEYDLAFHPEECDSSELNFSPGEHQWMVNFADCTDRSSLSFDGDHYQLLNVHIHSVSEHENGGSCHDAEIHMVHVREGTDDDLLVVGVLLDATMYGTNNMLGPMWEVLSLGEQEDSEDADEDHEFTMSPYEMLPAGPEYSHYMGSLTTPPCTEGVKWIVMTDTTMLGLGQLTTFRAAVGSHLMVDQMGNTNRPVQPLNGREVHYISVV